MSVISLARWETDTRSQFGWLAAMVCLGVLGKATAETPLALFVSVAILLVALISVRFPWLGLIALFPLSFALAPAPEAIGLREAAIGALCVAIMVGTVWRLARDGALLGQLRRWLWLITALKLFLALNLWVALGNAVPVSDWARGLIPFVFLTLFLPAAILLDEVPRRLEVLGLAVLGLGLLLVVQVLFVYFAEGLHRPFFYRLIAGEYVSSPPPADPKEPGDILGPYYFRVTTRLAQSTDALLPLTLATAFVVSVMARERVWRACAFGIACLAAASILATYTRSMLLCGLLGMVGFGIVLLALNRQHFLRAVGTGAALVIVSIGVVFAINLDPVWTNRTLQLYYSLGLDRYLGPVFEWMQQAWQHAVAPFQGGPTIEPPSLDPAIFASDVNVLTRLEEYRIAWARFLEQPWTGAGLGIRHEITFETSTGEQLVQQVGYVHNWIFYFLMVSGVFGTLLYAAILFGPVATFGTGLARARMLLTGVDRDRTVMVFSVIATGVLVLAAYGLFFAVFRLISFNLVLAASIGTCVAYGTWLKRVRS